MVVKVVMNADKCEQCHGAEIFRTDVTRTGSSCGQTIDHAVNCPVNYCEHGKRVHVSGQIENQHLMEECAPCEAEEEAEALRNCEHDFVGNDYGKPCVRCGVVIREDDEEK